MINAIAGMPVENAGTKAGWIQYAEYVYSVGGNDSQDQHGSIHKDSMALTEIRHIHTLIT